MRSKLSIVILVFVLLLTNVTVLTSQTIDASLPSSESIVIDGDLDLIAHASTNGWPGSGTLSNPYIIANLTFDGLSDTAIMISNVDMNVVIYNCTVTNFTNGIKIAGSSHITISDNYCNNGEYAVSMEGSDGAIISNNTITDVWCGIRLASSCNNNTISNNTITEAESFVSYDIQILGSSNNTVNNNTLSSDDYCLYIGGSNNNTVFENKISHGSEGILIKSSNNNTVFNNTVNDSVYGFLLAGNNDDTVFNNTVNGGYIGFRLTGLSHNKINNNTITDAMGFGIFVYLSTVCLDNNTLTNCAIRTEVTAEEMQSSIDGLTITSSNTVNEKPVYFLKNANMNNETAPSGFGEIVLLNVTNLKVTGQDLSYGAVMVGFSSNIAIEDNTITTTNENAVYLYSSDHCTISGNDIASGYVGVYLRDTDNCTITNNIIAGDKYDIETESYSVEVESSYDIKVESSVNTTISNNALTGPGYGIELTDTDDNIISNNTIAVTSGAGILLDSGNTYLNGNKLTNCTIDLQNMADEEEYIDELTITSSNTVNEKPVYFLKNANMNNETAPSGFGEILLLNVTNLRVTGQDLSYGAVMVGFSSNIVIEDNTITNATPYAVNLFSSDRCTISGNDVSGQGGISLNQANFNTISHNNLTMTGEYGIQLEYSSNNTIFHNNLTMTGGYDKYGIQLEYSSNNTMDGNDITGAWCSINVDENCDNNSITGNTMNDTTYGVDLGATSNDNTVSNNVITAEYTGIYMRLASYNTVSGNYITGASQGIYLDYNCDHNVISGNTVINCTRQGIYVGNSCENNTISDNVVDGDGADIYLSDSSYNNISNNSLTGADYGIKFFGSSNNTVSHNAITNNTNYGIYLSASSNNHLFGNVLSKNNGTSSVYDPLYVQAFDDGTNNWNTTSYGNYWSDWQASDANADGIVDVPYALDGGNSLDDLPLTLSINIASPKNDTYVTSSSVTVTWNSSIDIGIAHFLIKVDNGSWQYVGAGNVSAVFAGLDDGEHIVAIEIIDPAGNIASDNVTFTVDTVAPTSSNDGLIIGAVVIVIIALLAVALVVIRRKKK